MLHHIDMVCWCYYSYYQATPSSPFKLTYDTHTTQPWNRAPARSTLKSTYRANVVLHNHSGICSGTAHWCALTTDGGATCWYDTLTIFLLMIL
jgi:hypothetical protein